VDVTLLSSVTLSQDLIRELSGLLAWSAWNPLAPVPLLAYNPPIAVAGATVHFCRRKGKGSGRALSVEFTIDRRWFKPARVAAASHLMDLASAA
jgi:hypothetical protein